MSDAFLRGEIELEARRAMQQIDRLAEALHRATTDVIVTADTRGVTTAIEAAILNADPTATVTADAGGVTTAVEQAIATADTAAEVAGDARQVTAAIDSAVDAADTSVEVTADAGRVTGAIDAAVDAADTSVEVTGQVDRGLVEGSDQLAGNLAAGAAAGGLLTGALGGLGAAAAAGGLFFLADAASELEQAVGGTEAVFREASVTIDRFARTSGQAAGLVETSFRNLTSQTGAILSGLGFAREEAARWSVELAQLGADLAATFGGAPQEAVEALGAALRGEFNPLERFGVAMNVAQIEAYALANGLAASKAEVDLSVRAQAALALIMERTTAAQGQFAREAQTMAGRMAIARAEAGNLAAQVGDHLDEAFISLINVVTEQVLPAMAEFGEDVLPLVADVIENLAPLLGTTTGALEALSAVLRPLLSLLGAIPGEVLGLAGGLITVNRLAGLVRDRMAGAATQTAAAGAAAGTAAEQTGRLARAQQGLARFLSPVNIALTIGFAALNQWSDAANQARQASAEVEAQTEGLQAAFQSAADEGRSVASALRDFVGQMVTAGDVVEHESRRVLAGFRSISADEMELDEVQRLVGLTSGQLAALLTEGPEGVRDFTRALQENSRAVNADTLRALANLQQLAQTTNAAARAQIEAGIVTGRFTREQELQFRAVEALTFGTRNYVQALAELEVEAATAARRARAVQERYGPTVEQFRSLAGAIENVTAEAPALGAALGRIGAEGVLTDRRILNLVRSTDLLALSEEGLADVANFLGVELEELEGIIDGVADALDGFVSRATQGLPSVASAIEDAFADGVPSLRGIIRALTGTGGDGGVLAALEEYRENLRTVTEAGFGDLASRFAEQGYESGSALMAQAAAAIEDGDTELLDGVREAMRAVDREFDATVGYLRDVIGPEFILQTGLIASFTNQAWSGGLDFASALELRMSEAFQALADSPEAQAIAVIAAEHGEYAAELYGEALNLDERTVEAGIAAADAWRGDVAPRAEREADRAGIRAAGGFFRGEERKLQDRAERARVGRQAEDAVQRALQHGETIAEAEGRRKAGIFFRGMEQEAGKQEHANRVRAAIEATITAAFSGIGDFLLLRGSSAADDIIEGLVQQVRNRRGEVAEAGRSVGAAMDGALANFWQSSSPSRLAARRADEYVAGLLRGLRDTAELVAEAQRLAGDVDRTVAEALTADPVPIRLTPEIGPLPERLDPVTVPARVLDGDDGTRGAAREVTVTVPIAVSAPITITGPVDERTAREVAAGITVAVRDAVDRAQIAAQLGTITGGR